MVHCLRNAIAAALGFVHSHSQLWHKTQSFIKQLKLYGVGEQTKNPSKPPKDWTSKMSRKNILHRPVAISWLILAGWSGRKRVQFAGGRGEFS